MADPANITIRVETPPDVAEITAVHSDAFGPSDSVCDLVKSLREVEAVYPTISLVAEDRTDSIVGHIMMSHSWLDADERMIDVLVVSPLGVLSEQQKKGIGTALLECAIQAAEDVGAPLLFLEGNPSFYGSRGFESAKPLGFRAPSLRIPDKAFQVRKLANYSSEMKGTLVFRDIFWQLDCVGLRKT